MPVKTKFRWELIKSLFLLCDTANQVICNYTYVRNSWPTGSVGTLKRKAWTKDLFQVLCNITNRFITVAFSFSLGFLLLKIFNDLSLHVCRRWKFRPKARARGWRNGDPEPSVGSPAEGREKKRWVLVFFPRSATPLGWAYYIPIVQFAFRTLTSNICQVQCNEASYKASQVSHCTSYICGRYEWTEWIFFF